MNSRSPDLGLPALAVLTGLAVPVPVAACWIIGSADRSGRLARIMLARRGNAHCLVTPSVHAGPRGPAVSGRGTPPPATTSRGTR
jgi:hypothetical protein